MQKIRQTFRTGTTDNNNNKATVKQNAQRTKFAVCYLSNNKPMRRVKSHHFAAFFFFFFFFFFNRLYSLSNSYLGILASGEYVRARTPGLRRANQI